jgi:hypothetical protein
MKVVYNNIIPFKGFKCINLFGVLFVRKGCFMSEKDLNHEAIHTTQMKEMLYIGFYLWYFVEWLVELFTYGSKSYHTNTFEREAFENERDLTYLDSRRRFAWWKYL